MQIWYRRLAALLAVFMLLAALAACANDERDDEQAAGPAEAGEKITQAELDWVWQSMRFKDETVTQAEALTALLEERAVLLEAESLGIAPSLEEARQQAQENYNQFLGLYASSDSQNVHGAQEAWQALQDYMQYMGLEEEEYLEEAAKAQQVMMAKSAVIENFEADLPQAVLADDLARTKAWNEHFEELVAQYQPQLLSAEQIQFLAENLTGEVTIIYGE